MNRQIKFRAEHKGKIYEVENIYFQDELITLVVGQFQKGTVLKVRIEDVNLMQYTGLKDKNGKEIYESDVIEYEWNPLKPQRGEVCFYGGMFCLLGEGEYMPSEKNREVIGNIYQNPDLFNN